MAAETAAATTSSTEDVDSARKRRVYVGNLAWSVSWQDLKDIMKTTGHEVTRADIMLTPDGRSKGCGIVEFATVEGAVQAVTDLNDIELNGRRIFVREDREHRGGVGPAMGTGRFIPYQHHQLQNRPNHSQNYQYHTTGGDNNCYHHSNYSGGAGQGFEGTPGTNIQAQTQSRRVYVGNLSWNVSWQELKEHMWAVGNVVHAEIITEPNGRSKGCGIVEYSTEMEALQAISSMTHTELKGRNIFVREDREGSGGNMMGACGSSSQNHHYLGTGMNSSVYVWNLSYDTSWQDLKDHMRKAGNVNQVTILTNANDGSSLGCGIVEYQKSQDAQRAIRELQDSELNGRPLKLREDRAGGSVGGRGGGGRHSGRGRGGRGPYGGGRSGFRNFHQTPPGPIDSEPVPEGTQLYVGNLPYEINWKDLKEHFESVGEVIRVNVKMGYGTVRFANKEDAEKAVATLHGIDFQGRTLNVRLDNKL
jgi:RNA recognition motif-containing protein